MAGKKKKGGGRSLPVKQTASYKAMEKSATAAKKRASALSKRVASMTAKGKTGRLFNAGEAVVGAAVSGYALERYGIDEVLGIDPRAGVGLLMLGASFALPDHYGAHVAGLAIGPLASYASDYGAQIANGGGFVPEGFTVFTSEEAS